jgi:indole-3-glycerol phosphate synthase
MKTFFQGELRVFSRKSGILSSFLSCAKSSSLYPYQMYLARFKGADAVLLIAAIL